MAEVCESAAAVVKDTPSRRKRKASVEAEGPALDDLLCSKGGGSGPAEGELASFGGESKSRTRTADDCTATPIGSSASARRARVSFGHVQIRTHDVEMWGGGGVPADDGPPLGLGWGVKEEREVDIDAFEGEREGARTPKDSYCMVGCVEAQKRQEMLVASGCTPKQIKAVTKQVAQLNQDRWQASELLFGDAWLFRAPRHSDNGELLAMLGQPECHGSELSAANWHSAEACARELAQSLRVQVETLYSPSSSEVGEAKRGHRRVGGSGSGSGDVHGGEGHSEVLSRGREDKGACKYRYQDEGEETGEEAGEEEEGEEEEEEEEEGEILWTACSEAMQALKSPLVLLIRCDQAYDGALNMLGRLVGCAANAHIATQVRATSRCRALSVRSPCALRAARRFPSRRLPSRRKHIPTCVPPECQHACLPPGLVRMRAFLLVSFPQASLLTVRCAVSARGECRYCKRRAPR